MCKKVVLSGEGLHKEVCGDNLLELLNKATQASVDSGKCLDIYDDRGRLLAQATPKGVQVMPWVK